MSIIESLDHLVLTVEDISCTCDFYRQALGLETITFARDRKALMCGNQKINLHQRGRELEPKAKNPKPGAADFCLITAVPSQSFIEHLTSIGVPIVQGPVKRIGALGAMVSVYFRDPDGNLVEIANYAEARGERGVEAERV